MTGVHHDQIADAARWAAGQVEQALEMARKTQVLECPCPHCRGVLRVEGGDGGTPVVRCEDCSRTWSEQKIDVT